MALKSVIIFSITNSYELFECLCLYGIIIVNS